MAQSNHLPLPEPAQPTGVRIKEVPEIHSTPWWAWVLIVVVVVSLTGVIGLVIFHFGDTASAHSQDAQIAATKASAERTDCSLRISGEYEDHRDDVITALGISPTAGREAAAKFAQFRLSPDGKSTEKRSTRTVRECGSALDAVKSGVSR